MKKGEKRKQDKALKRRTERKLQKQQAAAATRGSPAVVRRARTYPLEGCWIRADWEETGLAVVVVARRQPDGNIIFGNYLVDRYCLGLKNTYYEADVPRSQFRSQVLPRLTPESSPEPISPALAHEIVYGGIEYAAQLGFRPQRDWRLSQFVLDPPEAHPRTGQVEFGYQGQPLFISGPYDNVDAIRRQLDRTAGPGNYHFLIGLDPGANL